MLRRNDERSGQSNPRPLTPLEAPLWAFEQLGNRTANIVPVRLERCGPIDCERVARTLSSLASSHPALRLCLPDPGRPHVSFVDTVSFSVGQQVVGSERSTDPELELRIIQQCKIPFDLSAAPLMRAAVFQISPARGVLLFTFHHLVLDGWSAALFIKEFTAHYDGDALDRGSSAETDLTKWWSTRLTPSRMNEVSKFWHAELAEVPAAVCFDDGGEDRPASCASLAKLEECDARLIKAAAMQAGVSLYAWLIASLAILINRHTGARQLVIGAPVAFRPDEALRDVFGCMVASVPVRLSIDDDTSFAELAKRARSAVLRAISHADTPFHVIRTAAGGPPFDIMLNLLSFPKPGQLGSDWEVKHVAPAASRFNSTFYVDWSPEGGSITLVRDTERVSEEYASVLLAQFLHLLRETARTPSLRIGSFGLSPGLDEQRNQLLAMPLPYDDLGSPVGDIVRIAAEQPAAVAIEHGNLKWSYADLDRASARLARSLLRLASSRGRTPGHPVVTLHGEKSFGLIALVVGALRAGLPFLLVDPFLPRERVEAYEALLGRPITVSVKAAAGIEDMVVDPSTAEVRGGEASSSDVTIDRACGRDPAYVMFTSGTTGEPKGILGTHTGLAHFIRWQRDTFQVTRTDRVPVITGLGFDVILREILTPLCSGATLCLPPRAGGGAGMLAWAAGLNATVLHVVPSLARRWLREAGKTKLRTLRATFFAGETLTRDLVKAWLEVAPNTLIVNLFGPSETTLAKCSAIVSSSERRQCIPVGRPLPDTQVFVERAGFAAATGEIGEIVLRTPYRSLGYVHGGSNQFRRNPFGADEGDVLYWTGDLGRILCDGSLQLLGRSDRQVKIRGVRVELDEVAAILRGLNGVKDGAVIFDHATEKLLAFVVADVLPRTVALKLRELLPSAMVPSKIVPVATIPTTANGKVDFRTLLAGSGGEDLANGSMDPPGDPTTLRVVECWRRYVSSKTVGFDDDFFETGGDSLDLIGLHADLCEALGRELNLAAFFRRPVLRNICELVAQDAAYEIPYRTPARTADRESAARRKAARETWLDQGNPS